MGGQEQDTLPMAVDSQQAQPAAMVSPWAAPAVQGEERKFDMVPQPIMTPKMLRPGCVSAECVCIPNAIFSRV